MFNINGFGRSQNDVYVFRAAFQGSSSPIPLLVLLRSYENIIGNTPMGGYMVPTVGQVLPIAERLVFQNHVLTVARD